MNVKLALAVSILQMVVCSDSWNEKHGKTILVPSSVIVVVGRVEPGPRLIRGDCRAGLLLGAEKSIQQRLARARLFLNVNVVRALVLGRRSELLALRDRELGHAIIVILHR